MRELLRIAASSGFSYVDIAKDVRLNGQWNEASIKQFAYRKGNPRIDEKTRQLALVILEFYENRPHESESITKAINTLKNELNQHSEDSIFDIVDESFDLANANINNLILPNSFCFARFDSNNKYIVFMKIDIIKTRDGIVFITKISGKNDRKRVVIGRVSGSAMNTHLTGLAFTVSSQMSPSQFEEFDVTEHSARKNILSDNPMGIEHISIPNFNLYSTEFPVVFCGLDGRGFPIGGIGVFINEHAFDRFGIAGSLMGRIECLDNKTKIHEFMERTSCKTYPVPTEY